MKKITFLLLFSFISLSAASQNIFDSFYLKKLKEESFVYSDTVEYTLKTVTHSGTSFSNKNVYYIAPKGEKFKILTILFKNNSQEDQIIDFTKFFLVDKLGQTHHVSYITQSMKIYPSEGMYSLQQKIKAGKTKTMALEFWPPFPKDEFPSELIVNDRTIVLEKAAKK